MRQVRHFRGGIFHFSDLRLREWLNPVSAPRQIATIPGRAVIDFGRQSIRAGAVKFSSHSPARIFPDLRGPGQQRWPPALWFISSILDQWDRDVLTFRSWIVPD